MNSAKVVVGGAKFVRCLLGLAHWYKDKGAEVAGSEIQPLVTSQGATQQHIRAGVVDDSKKGMNE